MGVLLPLDHHGQDLYLLRRELVFAHHELVVLDGLLERRHCVALAVLRVVDEVELQVVVDGHLALLPLGARDYGVEGYRLS